MYISVARNVQLLENINLVIKLLNDMTWRFKGTVMQIEKALITDRLRVSKVSRKFRIPTIYNFAIIYQ